MNPITDTLVSIGMKLTDRVFPDPAAQAAAQLELLKLNQTGELAQLAADTDLAKAQINVNAVEAASDSLFVSGWRPFIGWVCGTACAWNWIFLKIVVAILALPFIDVTLDLQPADLSEMLPVLGGLLGLGILRTVEKVKGTK